MKRALGTAGRLVLATFALVLAAAPAAARKSEPGLQDQLMAHIRVLAGDDYEGREPGTDGEAKTLRYLAAQWFDIGLVSGTNDPGNAWFAPVTLVAREPQSSSAQFTRRGRRVFVDPASILVLTSGSRSLVRSAPLIFVGSGKGEPPSRNELAGRVAVLLDGRDETSERQDKLLAAGASAVMTVLDGDRSLDSVAARRKRSGYALAQDSTGGDLEVFITRQSMARLLQGSGMRLEPMEQDAVRADFVPRPLDLAATLEATTRETRILTHNLIGKIPGRRPESGAVLFVAHWDHFGICAEPPAEDIVCNGAIDNASGVAALTEVARRLQRGPRMDRDLYFLATTAEELGLLGAHAFADDPPIPLMRIVAAFNIDSIAVAPAGSAVGIVGRGMTPLDSQIEAALRAQRLEVVPGDGANAYVKRQDGWALLQHDIPAVMVTSAYSDLSRIEAFFEGRYHRPGDDLSNPIELGGAAQDVQMLVGLGRWFADPRKVKMRVK